MSRRPPRLPDPALLGPRPFGSAALGAALRRVPLCVAVSGGADSTALLHALVRLRTWLGAKPPCGLVAAHFNHGVRGAASDGDEAFVENLCAGLGVPLVRGRGDVPAEAARTGESLEMAARRLRHAFLREAADGRPVATGHTLDDQAELFFLRLRRGAGLRGLAGMSPGPGPILRPLLGVRHEALCAFLREEGLAWREDATNAEDSAERNRVRHRVLPAVLDAFGPSFLDTLARTMSVLCDDADLLDALAARGGKGAPLERRRIASRLYAEGVDPESVTLDAIERVRALVAGERNGEVPLGGGATARLAYGRLAVRPAGASDDAAEAPFAFDVPERLPRGGGAFGPGGALRVSRAWTMLRPGRDSPLARPVACTVAEAAVCGRRLELRPVRPGDRIRVVGEGHSRKLSDALAQLRVPRADRSRVRVLADAKEGGVLWLPGFGVDESVAVRSGDRILKLALCKGRQRT